MSGVGGGSECGVATVTKWSSILHQPKITEVVFFPSPPSTLVTFTLSLLFHLFVPLLVPSEEIKDR